MTKSLEVLAKNRDALLLAETAAWLHMLGKYHEEFIGGTCSLATEIPADLTKNFPRLDELLKDNSWPSSFWKLLPVSELKPDNLSIYDLIRYHSNKNHQSGFLKLLWDSHGRGSGTEKGILKKDSYDKRGKKENYKHVHLASAFGSEPEPIDADRLSNKKYQLYQFLEQRLNDLEKSLKPNSSWGSGNWLQWRKPFVERLEEDFSTTVSDDRRPINDVTLWDQTAATVAFFKAELAEVLLTNWKDPLDQSNKFKYRILRVALDGASFLAQSSRIGDVLSRKQILTEAFNKVKSLMEVEYPLGLEIYHDTNSVIFLTPDISDLLELKDGQNKALYQLLEEEFYSSGVFNGEVILDISLSPSGSRNVFFLGKQIAEPIKSLSPTVSFLKGTWKVTEDKCSICQVRPQGYGAGLIEGYKSKTGYYENKARKRKMCCVCMERLQGRSKNWATKELNETIWVDEVADINGRVALISGKFDLVHWLNGELISTFRNPKNDCGISFSELMQDLNRGPNKKLKELERYKKIAETHAETIQGLKDFLIKDEDLGEPEFSFIPDNKKLALAVWRKPPSFARIRRVWETTQDFWKESVEGKLKNIISIIGPRLVITGDFRPDNLGDYRAYAVELKGVETSFVYDKNNNRFINVSNLRYLAKRLKIQEDKEELTDEKAAQKIEEFITREFTKKKIPLVLYEELAQSGEQVEAATISQCKATIEQHNYLPVIPIATDPEQFIILIPADKALDLASHIQTEYEAQFSKVRNRLPFYLNIVFFNRKQPIYVALDAARRMLDRKSRHDELWEVQSISEADAKELCAHSNGRLTNHCKYITLKRLDDRLNKTCNIFVSYGLGDPNKVDAWYPYFFAEAKALGTQAFSQRDHYFSAPFPDSDAYKMKDLVHAVDLKAGDQIYYAPSTLDFEFLDVTARRFELSYDEASGMRLPKADELYSTRPFLLEDLDIIQQLWKLVAEDESTAITTTQLRQITEAIETKRQDWQITEPDNDTLRRFVEQTFQRAFGKRWNKVPEDQRERLILWATSGRWRDIIELEMQILKKQSLAAKASQVK